jgi:methyl-accepting chemotaxis protein
LFNEPVPKDEDTGGHQIPQQYDLFQINVEKQTESVNQPSSAIEEMLANVQSVTQTLVRKVE